MVAGDLEPLEEAAGLHAEREGDADVTTLVGTARKCDWQLMLLSNGGSLDQESSCCCKEY